MSNIFILNTGRCGSTTFIQACRHISNYSSGHESRCNLLGGSRFKYPANHIEADNRISWLLGRLDDRYGNRAYYVHLRRDNLETARSFTKRYSGGIIKAYRGMGILMGLPENTEPMAVALDYCETVNKNIEHFLKDKTLKMTVSLENLKEDFTNFWYWVGAEGDLEMALQELQVRHNSSK